MSSVNKVTLIGNLGADPQSRSFQSGGKVVNFRIATSERWKDRTSGEQKERTEWHSIVVMNEGLCAVAEKYLRKGSKAYVEGQLRTRKWTDRQNIERYSTEVVLSAFNSTLVLLDGKQADPGRHDYAGHGDMPGGGGAGQGGGRRADDLDDDVPF